MSETGGEENGQSKATSLDPPEAGSGRQLALQKLLCVVMDGVGFRDEEFGNAPKLAKTPVLDALAQTAIFTTLQAHGKAVGLPSNKDIGNSEVGHNAMGAGRIFAQGAKLVQNAIDSKAMFEDATWLKLVNNVKDSNSTLHFLGLLSDGNVHAHEDHLYAMMRAAKAQGVRRVRVHVLFDGRDVEEKSAERYVRRLTEVMTELGDDKFDVKAASGGGRMHITMDRYGADWSMVEKGWRCHVLGEASLTFSSLAEAVAYFRSNSDVTDQYIPDFVIERDGVPCGTIEDDDSVILFNFRGDRAIEITRTFIETDFKPFDRVRWPQVHFAGMMQYDGDLQLPPDYLVTPPAINHVLSEVLIGHGARQFACSETQKFGHVTYFWNGNRSGFLNPALEKFIEVPSDSGITFDQQPAMKAVEITDATIDELENDGFDFGRINYANGDMVGHTGDLPAAMESLEVVDQQVGRLIKTAEKTGAVVIVTADHGNCDEMFEGSAKDFPNWRDSDSQPRPLPKTAHTLAPVPFYLYLPQSMRGTFELAPVEERTLGNIANTVLTLMGLPTDPLYLPPLVRRVGVT